MQLQIVGTLLLSGVFLLSGGKTIPAPALLSPANGAVMDNGCYPKRSAIVWDFDWTDVPGADAYYIKVWMEPHNAGRRPFSKQGVSSK